MTARDIMTTQVLTALPTTTVKEAMNLLVEVEISGLIVTDAENNIMGVVTERDLLVAFDFLGHIKAPIADFMHKGAISVQEDTSLTEVSQLLVQGDVRRVPVVRDTKVIGVVSRRDILRYILRQNKQMDEMGLK